MNILPKAKLENIVISTLKDEVLIYNLSTNQAFCLNDTAAKVFNACDGVQTFADLKNKHQLTEEIIFLALDELKGQKLIADEYLSPFAGLSRREAFRRAGLASMIALPVIAGIVAPGAAAAASVLLANNQTCTTQAFGNSTECQSGNCVNSRNVNGIYTLRCCALSSPGNQGTTGFIFYPATDQADCDFQASFRTQCCSGAATYDDNTGNCTCT